MTELAVNLPAEATVVEVGPRDGLVGMLATGTRSKVAAARAG